MLRKILFTAVVAATAAASMNAAAIGRLADVTVIDRSTGQTLPVHLYRGEYWVAGTPGAAYSVAVTNGSGGRVMAVMSVDGVNVLNGQTASVNQSGYVFNPYQRYEVTGWRKSNQEVATFEFVASPASYAERTGRPANVGVIGVAIFKERLYQPPVSVTPPSYRYRGNDGTYQEGKRAPSETGAPDGTLARPAPSAAQSQPGGGQKHAEASDTRDKLGTGHGEREWSEVLNTSFDRAQSVPNETIRIRYDSPENLIAMGVIQPPRPNRPWYRGPDAFPESRGYVPDPPRYSR